MNIITFSEFTVTTFDPIITEVAVTEKVNLYRKGFRQLAGSVSFFLEVLYTDRGEFNTAGLTVHQLADTSILAQSAQNKDRILMVVGAGPVTLDEAERLLSAHKEAKVRERARVKARETYTIVVAAMPEPEKRRRR